ncbi:MAG: hypothetical protein ACREQV_26540 [Candidatus Binatia bacterium]
MLRYYLEMIGVNTQEVDDYYHCMANCAASRLGVVGRGVSQIISDFRELWQVRFGGESLNDCAKDQVANYTGRFAPTFSSCHATCKQFAPPGFVPLGRKQRPTGRP